MTFQIRGSLVLLSLLSTQAWAAAPEGLHLRALQYNGTSCPLGSARAVLQPNGDLIVILPESVVEWGPSYPKVYSRKSCTVSIDLAVPAGWQYAVTSLEASGEHRLATGLKAELGLQHFFEGGSASRWTRTYLGENDPSSSFFIVREFTPSSELVWSRCGRSPKLNFNLTVKVVPVDSQNPPAGWGLLQLGLDGESPLTFGLAFRNCQP